MMNYEKMCDEILDLNQNIRYAAVYDYGELHDKVRPGVKSHLSREETETSLSQAIYRWSTRKKTADKIGTPIFALAKYEKIGIASPLISNFINTPETGAISTFMQEPTFSLHMQTTL